MRGDPVLVLQRPDLQWRDVLDEVDLTLDQGLDRRVVATEDPELDLVDVRSVAPVVLVGHEAELGAAGRPSTGMNGPVPTSGCSGVGSGW